MDDSLPQSVFTVKSCSKKLRIVTQCNNGPCPIIAILNCLILQDRIKQPAPDSVTAEEMMTQLGNYILKREIPEECTELLHAQSTSLEVCSSQQLLKGLDINVKFKAVDAFEFTPMLTLFDFLDIKLFHCWAPSPDDDEYEELSKLSYNELVTLLFDDEKEKLKIWYNQTASQATEYGIFQIRSKMKPGEIAVLFRNNHYFVVTFQNDVMYSLITDQGYLHSPELVWEELTVSCDGLSVNDDFLTKAQLLAIDEKKARELQEKLFKEAQQEARQSPQRRPPTQVKKPAAKKTKESKDGCFLM
jgi:hypothetical protein